MERKVTWSLPAVIDLENIRDYIARDSERYALIFVEEIVQESRTLSSLSERGRVVPELNEPSVRELFIKRHRLIYELTTERVDILGVIHMSRDLSSLWKGKQ